MNRRRFILRSLGATLALPGLCSLSAKALSGNPTVQTSKGAGIGARRFVAIGNLLGYQTKQLFPKTAGRDFEKTTLLEPIWEHRELMTVFRGLDHGVKAQLLRTCCAGFGGHAFDPCCVVCGPNGGRRQA